MKDERVTRETALLAKEIGYDIPCDALYPYQDSYVIKHSAALRDWNNVRTSPGEKTLASAPTQTALIRWLLEVEMVSVEWKSNGGHDKWVGKVISYKGDEHMVATVNLLKARKEKAIEICLVKALYYVKKHRNKGVLT